jgi:LmbE family N-acetylglucosaminyl deacetylase/SAM-dependent methyltransferase
MRRVLWVFAHQDDEVAAAARMLEQTRRGDELWCAYLTNGAAKVSGEVRNAESLAALFSIGVTNVLFFDAPDGALHEHLQPALTRLEARFDGMPFDEVGCLAWEGGHQDHDAAHLVALAFARRRGVPAWEVPLYNGYGVPGQFFRVLRPIGEGWERSSVPFRDAWRVRHMIRCYRSQRRTWLGLMPEALLRLFVLRRTVARRADPARVAQPPHEGRLFYERRFRCERAAFERAAAPFVQGPMGPMGPIGDPIGPIGPIGPIRPIVPPACPVCNGTAFTRRRLLPNLAVLRCTACGLRTSDIVKTKSVSYAHIDDAAYLQSIGLLRQQQAKAIVGAVTATGEWLDIGCGFGFVLDEARRAGFAVRGVEPDPKAAVQARERLGVEILPSDDHRPSDVISTLDVIEHIPPAELHAFAEDIRRRAALWVIKVPSCEGLFYKVAHALLPFTRSAVRRLWQSDHEYPHTIYFDEKTLTRFLRQHGFTIERIRYLEEMPDATALQRLQVDPTIPRWQALIALPLVRLVNRVERWRAKSDALLVLARSDHR